MAINQAPRRLRVVHVTLGLEMGGQERLLTEFARLADRRRFDLEFLTLTTRGPLAQGIVAQGWPLTALDTGPGLRPGLVWRLMRFFVRGRFDVVHTHDDKPLVYGAPAAALARTKRRIHTQHHGQLGLVTPRQAFLIRQIARLTHCFVCVSEDSARRMLAQGLKPGQVLTIHNGIDLEHYSFVGPCASGPVVTVARLSPAKDIATLLQAMALAVKSIPDLRLEIAGAGPCGPELRQLATDLNLNEQVHFLGETQAVPALLARASLFVLPSRSEGISLTLLEAMARGLPVLACRVGGNPEVVDDGVTGRLVPAGDPQALAQEMAALLSDPDRARQWGQAGRRRVEDKFDIGRMVAQYEQLYLGLGR